MFEDKAMNDAIKADTATIIKQAQTITRQAERIAVLEADNANLIEHWKGPPEAAQSESGWSFDMDAAPKGILLQYAHGQDKIAYAWRSNEMPTPPKKEG